MADHEFDQDKYSYGIKNYGMCGKVSPNMLRCVGPKCQLWTTFTNGSIYGVHEGCSERMIALALMRISFK